VTVVGVLVGFRFVDFMNVILICIALSFIDFLCLLQSLDVFSPPGQLAGTVEQEWSICVPKFVVKNAEGEVVLRIEGPFCTFSLCGSVEFQVI